MALRWQVKRDTAAQWTANNPILAEGEFGVETESIGTSALKIKMGDGITPWANLAYALGQKQVERFLATSGQLSHTVSAGKIADDGLSEIQVNGQIWNSRTGILDFATGNISIDFNTGEITFHIPLSTDDQVIIKHN